MKKTDLKANDVVITMGGDVFMVFELEEHKYLVDQEIWVDINDYDDNLIRHDSNPDKEDMYPHNTFGTNDIIEVRRPNHPDFLIPGLSEGWELAPIIWTAFKKESRITAVKVVPNQKAEVVELDNTLEAFQEAIGGHIQSYHPDELDFNVILLRNEDGRVLEGVEPNRIVRDEDGAIVDLIFGTFLIVGNGVEDFTSLSPERQKKYVERFGEVERFSDSFIRHALKCL